eukprot:TRINITY_DN87695_c0_g1_i1.p2 TRINITY_DN87695_c0_g1~~TRINITY_DN87695_c0_g1_i1.p2  ORF type:complete len:109 (+),score=1.85 TRINITY_DN87695_c0_g1_i1:51-329(+)
MQALFSLFCRDRALHITSPLQLADTSHHCSDHSATIGRSWSAVRSASAWWQHPETNERISEWSQEDIWQGEASHKPAGQKFAKGYQLLDAVS